MPPPESFTNYERRRVMTEALSPAWVPYLGIVVAAFFFYFAAHLLLATDRAAVECAGTRGELLCRVIFDPLQLLLPGRGTNVAYSLVFVLAGAVVGIGSAKRLIKKRKNANGVEDAA